MYTLHATDPRGLPAEIYLLKDNLYTLVAHLRDSTEAQRIKHHGVTASRIKRADGTMVACWDDYCEHVIYTKHATKAERKIIRDAVPILR